MRSVVMLFLFFITFSSWGNLCLQNTSIENVGIDVGQKRVNDFVPYPWGYELPFPWLRAQGFWKISADSVETYYSFQVIRQSETQEKQLLIRQFDPKTCEIVAIGVGTENGHRTVWAHMKPMYLPKAYRLALRNFKSEQLPKDLPSSDGRVMVMSVSQSGTLKDKHFPMLKITTGSATSVMTSSCEWAL